MHPSIKILEAISGVCGQPSEAAVVGSILDSMTDSLMVLGEGGTILYANRATSQTLGYSPSELMEKGAGALSFSDEANVEFRRILEEAVEKNVINNYCEVDYHHPDGSAKRLAATTSYFIAEGEHHSELMGFVAVLKDITEIARLRRHEEELVRERDRIAQEKLRSLRRLAMGVAHEIRNPTVTIGGFASRILRDDRSPEQIRGYAQIILEDARRLELVVERVQQCCQLPDLCLRQGDISSVVADVVATLRLRALQKNVTLRIHDELGDRRRVTFDPELLRLALVQVVENAIDFSYEGTFVEILLASSEEGTSLEVTDYGVGIRPEDSEFVFNPFFSTRNDGTGMGLAIAERVVQEHMGRIEVNSEPGRRTTIRIMLPRCLDLGRPT